MKSFVGILSLAFSAAAFAAGPAVDLEKPYSTVTEAMKLVADGKAPAGRYLFDAARCAEATGDSARAQELLACFVAKEPKPTTELRRALVRLCRAGASSEYFRRYLKQFAKDDDALQLGLDQAHRFATQSNLREFNAMIAMLLENWPRGDGEAEVMFYLQRILESGSIPAFHDGSNILRALECSSGYEPCPAFVQLVNNIKFRRTKITPEIKAHGDKGLAAYNEVRKALKEFSASIGKKGLADDKSAYAAAEAFFKKWPRSSFPAQREIFDLCDRLIARLEKNPGGYVSFPTASIVRILNVRRQWMGECSRTRQSLARVFDAQKHAADLVAITCREIDAANAAPGCRSACRAALVGVDLGQWRSLLDNCSVDWQKKTATLGRSSELSSMRYQLSYLKEVAGCAVPEFLELPSSSGISARTLDMALGISANLGDKAPREISEIIALAGEYRRVALPLVASGASIGRQTRSTDIAAVGLALKDLDATDPIGVKAAVFAAVRSNERDGEHALQLARRLVADKSELAYLVATRLADDRNQSAFAKIRTEASAKMPGLYPVGPNDPAYPIYVAADAFAADNFERAWSLISDRHEAFDRDPLKFRPDFALWVLEQYRRVKGREEVLLNKAAELMEQMLAKETILPLETVAGLYLLRAEIARDRMQNDAAHAAFVSVRGDKRFRGLAAARSAMFQDVDLLLDTGRADAAAQTAEAWLSDPEDEVRAQAHYVLAKVAFANKDYEETRKELERVFEIDFTHAEARLLQGAWKLATNYELDDTQVLLGDLADRRAIRPGQPLTVTVQDRNLSVAGGGQSIPVVVSTSAGGDEEKILLYTGTRDPSLFRGSIDTLPGVARKADGRLQLAGDDTVSYQIDPEYLKSRGLPQGEPKRLKVVDDADLTVNEGDQLKTIRPGTELRLRLKDADRTVHGTSQTVDLTVSTTSGDRLTAHLKETAPCSGVFEANVKTALPPPRSFASDTIAGGTAADLASSVRNQSWHSRADGVRPKSVGVDMMDSALVKSARLVTKDAANIPRVSLYGTLYGEERFLGSYPADSSGSRRGIHAYRRVVRLRNRADFLRDLAQRPVKAEPCADWEVRGKRGRDSREILRALVYVPETVRLRFRIESLAPAPAKGERDFRFGWGHAEMRCDGVLLFATGGNDALRFSREGVIEKGVHELELYVDAHNDGDQIAVRVENEDGSLSPLPKDWLDDEAHPELKARLVDVCSIVRGVDGFTASFAKPERLRKLRWEIVDFAGSSVSAEKLVVTGAGDRKLIPCEKDYAGALGDDTLDMAPGDVAKIVYDDQVTLSGRAREIEERVDAKFTNGSVSFSHEEIVDSPNGGRALKVYSAYRVAPGDTILVRVCDRDLNLSEGVDTAEVTLASDSGCKLKVKACERTIRLASGREVVQSQDEGVFYAQVPTVEAGAGNVPDGVLAIARGEGVSAIYVDEQNTDPGVKAERTARLQSVPDVVPTLKLASTAVRRVVDNSPEGKGRLATVRRRASSANATNAWKRVAEAKFPVKAETALVTPETSVPVELWAPGIVRHGASKAEVLVASKREVAAAKAEGREVNWARRTLTIGSRSRDIRISGRRIDQRVQDSLPDSLYGFIELKGASFEERANAALMDGDEELPEPVDVLAGDELVVVLPDADGKKPVAAAKAAVATTGWIALVDETLSAQVPSVHIGESFHVMVADADRDVTDEQDELKVLVTTKGGSKRTLVLRETMPRSGIFSASLKPVVALSSNGKAEPAETQEIVSSYSDEFTFTYDDEKAGIGAKPSQLTAKGVVQPGSSGSVHSYSKRFRDADQAVLVQFRLAECLFEMAKDYRKAKLADKSAVAIADGRRILDQALRDYPNSSHAAEGEYLLANLHENLAEEERQARAARVKEGEDVSGEEDKSIPLYNEAIARYASILSAWPNGEQAARCQYHKALCLERLGDHVRAGEEYVKITYLYPESPLVGDASVRLASHYYKEGRYDTAAKIYSSFRKRFPAHQQAANALFMSGQCQIRRAEEMVKKAEEEQKGPPAHLVREAYLAAVESFIALVENYRDTAAKDLLAQALYFAGDASFNARDYQNAYLYLKRTTFEYPESKWARHARGLLLQESKKFEEVTQE